MGDHDHSHGCDPARAATLILVVTDPREMLILDVLFALMLVGQVGVVWVVWEPDGPWRVLAYALLLVVMAGLWVYWRRHLDAAWAPIAFVMTGFVAMLVGDGDLSLFLGCFALIILVVARGPVAGIVIGIAMLIGQGLLMWLVYNADGPYIAVQLVAATVVLSITWLVATLLRLFAVASRDAQAARRALQDSFDVEKEALLAAERAREAGELHDGLGHQLTAIGLLLNAAQRLRESDPQRAWLTVEEARVASAEALTDMRTWVRAMHPTPLHNLEDGTAFQTLADRFRGSGLSVQVTTDIDQLTPEIALVVRRCVQEGLTNVVRHAGARRAHVEIDQSGGRVRVAISDDGTGAIPGRQGFGLSQLRSRVEELGGTLTTARSTLGGLRLEVAMPT